MDNRVMAQNFDPELEWYALRTRHQHEKVAATSLANKKFEIFLPLYETIRQWKGRKKRLSLPLFPGYIFLHGGLRRWREVVTTPGVHGLVQLGSRAAVIPEDEIESIRRVLNGPFQAEPNAFLKCGDWVRVKSGALNGIEGILVRKKNLFRLVLSVEMIGKSVSVEVDSTTVERVYDKREALQPAGRLPLSSSGPLRHDQAIGASYSICWRVAEPYA
jgi:transcription antitermination factor NusG